MAPRKTQSEDNGEPKARTLYTLKLDPEQGERLAAVLRDSQMVPVEVEHAALAYRGDDVNVVLYKSGKLVIQGKKTEDFVRDRLEPEVTLEARLGYDEIHHPEWFEPHAGLDESGKGDLFGPLVVATVIADGEAVRKWIEAGIRDSKSVTSDSRIVALEAIIRDTAGVVVETVFAGMEKYNQLHGKFGGNVNRLMAWMHATALRNAMEKKPVPRGLLDQFSKAPLVQRNIKDVPISLEMRPRAESDPVVAAASIIARAAFVRQMKKLSDEAGLVLARGAGALAKHQATDLVRRLGPEALGRFAKLHFKTAREAIEDAA